MIGSSIARRIIGSIRGGQSGSSAIRPHTTTSGSRKALLARAFRQTSPSWLSQPSINNYCLRSYAQSTVNDSGRILAGVTEQERRQMLKNAVASKRDKGDYTPSAMLKQVIGIYGTLAKEKNAAGLHVLFLEMARILGPDATSSQEAAELYLNAIKTGRDEAVILSAQTNLRTSLAGTFELFFESVIARPQGMKILIDMRADLLATIKRATTGAKTSVEQKTEIAQLKRLEASLADHLQHWFSVGFLELRLITWESPAALLEKIKAYSDSVHPVKDWNMLKNRLANNRRCFGFFHPSLPLEPLVFIEVALTSEISSKIAPILQGINTVPEADATTAIFYAITSTQPGLGGIDLGHMLIEQVVHALQQEFPKLNTFSTFSPVPTFKIWLDSKLAHAISTPSESSLLTPTEESDLKKVFLTLNRGSAPNAALVLQQILAIENWQENPALVAALQGPLTRLCAFYLAKERKRNLAVDPVANFHLRNGAQFHRVCWLADTSSKRLSQSCGLMVNYLYRLDRLVANNEAYLTNGQIATGEEVESLLSPL